jgi:hypothetical protein
MLKLGLLWRLRARRLAQTPFRNFRCAVVGRKGSIGSVNIVVNWSAFDFLTLYLYVASRQAAEVSLVVHTAAWSDSCLMPSST